MAQLTIDGTLTESPQGCGDSSAFPSASTVVPFSQNSAPQPKNVGASTGRKLLTLASGSFVTLVGGTDTDPTQMATVYARVASGGFQFRVTFNNPLGSPIVSVLPAAGVFLHEADAANGFYVTKFEVQGTGQIEFYASGAL